MDNDDKILEKWCKEEELDYHLASELKEKIFPILEDAHQKLGDAFDKALYEERKEVDIRLANSKRIILLLKKMKAPSFSIEERYVVSLHLEYLMLVEGLFAAEINLLIFILMANGHDLYSAWKGRYAKTLGDIEEENLAFKLRFLKEHGFEIITNKVDIKLRNSVAHLSYEIDDKGILKIGKRTVTEEDYSKLYDELRNVSYSLHLVYVLYYKRFA